MIDLYDVTIVGAGIAGSALAASVAKNNHSNNPIRVALIEEKEIHNDNLLINDDINNFDPRVSALTIGSKKILSDIGVWSKISSRRLCGFKRMVAWDSLGSGMVDFDASDVRQPFLGYIVENKIILSALHEQVLSLPMVDIFDQQSVGSFDSNEKSNNFDYCSIRLTDGRIIKSRLLIAADGASSKMRDMANHQTRQWDYFQDAIVCTIELEKGHMDTAWQRFTDFGPIALLPLKSNENKSFYSLVWSQSTEKANQLYAMDSKNFCRELSISLENRFGDVLGCSKRFKFKLRHCHSVDYISSRFVLVADAAHSIHPLAGQGINMGLDDIKVLSKLLLEAHSNGKDLSNKKLLSKYQRIAKTNNLQMIASIEALKKIFDPLPLSLRWLRNFGMRFFNKQTQIKKQVMLHAMGIK